MPFVTEDAQTKLINPGFKCRECGSDDVWFRNWESADQAHEDTRYECRACNRVWWVEGMDA